ncbi:MAG TPA: outer membrane lipoprotein-sorting protein [Vicinamibacterales bacterium]|jgi:hypothetical protein
MNTLRVVFAFGLIMTAGPAASDRNGALDGQTILARMEHANARRAEALAGYHVTRRYSVFEPGHPADAELVVGMDFEAPSTKTFRTIETHGVGWIERRVFRGLIAAETETAAGHKHHDSDVTAANYEPTLVGTEQRDGRDYYLVALQPKRADKYLFRGRVWIDKEDFGIARIEGEPARSPSFWIVRAPFVRDYQRIDGFWLPLQDETHTDVRFAGEYVLRIQYVDYQITHRA